MMSVELSEKTLSDENSREIAILSANLIATASALRGDPMKLWPVDPWIGDSSLSPEKTHTKPAFLPALSQAASVLQVMKSSSCWVMSACRDRLGRPEGTMLGVFVPGSVGHTWHETSVGMAPWCLSDPILMEGRYFDCFPGFSLRFRPALDTRNFLSDFWV